MKVSFCEGKSSTKKNNKGCDVNLCLEEKFKFEESQFLFRLKKGHAMKTGMFFHDTKKKKQRNVVTKPSSILFA